MAGSGQAGRRLSRYAGPGMRERRSGGCSLSDGFPARREARGAMRVQAGEQMSIPQFGCLNFIARTSGCSVGAAAAFLGVTMPTASAMVDRLERAGSVATSAPPAQANAIVSPGPAQGTRQGATPAPASAWGKGSGVSSGALHRRSGSAPGGVRSALYESSIQPITILMGLRSAAVGAQATLMLIGQDLTLIATIGILLLIGILKENAIRMIDFALDSERYGGMAPAEAIREACQLRFRPIMKTTVAAPDPSGSA